MTNDKLTHIVDQALLLAELFAATGDYDAAERAITDAHCAITELANRSRGLIPPKQERELPMDSIYVTASPTD